LFLKKLFLTFFALKNFPCKYSFYAHKNVPIAKSHKRGGKLIDKSAENNKHL